MIRYIHIGFPKCASTSLQKHLFSKHRELYHLGASAGGTAAPYLTPQIRTAIEYELRFAKDSVYDRQSTKRIFEEQFLTAVDSGKKAIGISSESISFTMHHDIDVSQKAERLLEIFGKNTKIIILIREQWSLLKSLYREYVVGGLHLTFEKFIQSIYINQGRSCLFDLNFHTTLELYRKLFSVANVHIVPFEALKLNECELLSNIQSFLEVSTQITHLEKENEKYGDRLIESIRRLNGATRPNHARSLIEPIGAFRYPDLFEEKLGIPIPAQILEDQHYIDSISDLANPNVLPYATEKANYAADELTTIKLNNLFCDWNQKLQSATQLPLRELGYLV